MMALVVSCKKEEEQKPPAPPEYYFSFNANDKDYQFTVNAEYYELGDKGVLFYSTGSVDYYVPTLGLEMYNFKTFDDIKAGTYEILPYNEFDRCGARISEMQFINDYVFYADEKYSTSGTNIIIDEVIDLNENGKVIIGTIDNFKFGSGFFKDVNFKLVVERTEPKPNDKVGHIKATINGNVIERDIIGLEAHIAGTGEDRTYSIVATDDFSPNGSPINTYGEGIIIEIADNSKYTPKSQTSVLRGDFGINYLDGCLITVYKTAGMGIFIENIDTLATGYQYTGRFSGKVTPRFNPGTQVVVEQGEFSVLFPKN